MGKAGTSLICFPPRIIGQTDCEEVLIQFIKLDRLYKDRRAKIYTD